MKLDSRFSAARSSSIAAWTRATAWSASCACAGVSAIAASLLEQEDGEDCGAANEQQRGKERVAIVALTANAGSDFEQRCESAGMDDFVTKPMQRSDLKRVIDAYANGPRD